MTLLRESAMMPGLFDLQIVQDFHMISAIEGPVFSGAQARTVCALF